MNLVFLHGINNTGRTFDALRADLPATWHSIAPDLAPLERVEDIVGALREELPETFVLVGHSFGGYCALALLDAMPERIEGLVLVNSSVGADSEAAAQARENRARDAEAGGYAKLVAAATAKSYHPDNLNRTDLMTAREREIEAYGADRFAAHNRACAARPDRTDVVARWTGPKRIIAAREDAVIPAARQAETAQQISAEYVEIIDAGHMLPAERPEALAREIVRFVDQIVSEKDQ